MILVVLLNLVMSGENLICCVDCWLKWIPDHAKEYSFDVIEFTMRANESCFDQFEFCKSVMKVLKLN